MTSSATTSDRNNALLTWYATHRRDLPWRRIDRPYATLVSEIMLQQTQVDRVIPKFEAFMARWPTVEDLAIAETTDVVSMWSGLGYNTRALRLKKAASAIADCGWPTTVSELQGLPGIGPYTASAIASISFGCAVAAVDTNVARVLSRWCGTPLRGSSLLETANRELGSPAGDWNQALMDLGSAICKPREPNCAACPVKTWCSDPGIYRPPPRQGSFKGSRRELRGALVRASIAKRDPMDVGRELGRPDDEIERVLDELRVEGLLG